MVLALAQGSNKRQCVAMKFSLKHSRLGLRNSTTRLPFRYGNTCLTRCPQAVLEVTIEADGKLQRGCSGDCLPPGWFDKSPNKSYRQQIEEMLAESPDDPELRYFLAMEYVSQRDDEGAAKQFRDLIAVAPDHVPAYLMAGQVYMRLGRPDDARAVLRRGIEAARRKGDQHARDEMQGFLESLE